MLYQSEEKEAQIHSRLHNILDDYDLSNEIIQIMNEFVIIPVEDIPAHTSFRKEGDYTTVYVGGDNVIYKDSENAWYWILRDLSALRVVTEQEFLESEEGQRRDDLAKEFSENPAVTFDDSHPALQRAILALIEKDYK